MHACKYILCSKYTDIRTYEYVPMQEGENIYAYVLYMHAKAGQRIVEHFFAQNVRFLRINLYQVGERYVMSANLMTLTGRPVQLLSCFFYLSFY